MLNKVRTISRETSKPSIYEPSQEGVIYPRVPTFDNFESERLHRKQRLVAACRAFALEKFDYGFAGHLTIRDPEHPELYWTNPMCVHFAQVKVSNLILADHTRFTVPRLQHWAVPWSLSRRMRLHFLKIMWSSKTKQARLLLRKKPDLRFVIGSPASKQRFIRIMGC